MHILQFNKFMTTLISAGRRGSLTLSSNLRFVTSTDEEPFLGFKTDPFRRFHEEQDSYLPTASTWVNSLTVPCPNHINKLPKAKELFELYEYAFANTFYELQWARAFVFHEYSAVYKLYALGHWKYWGTHDFCGNNYFVRLYILGRIKIWLKVLILSF